MSLSEYLDLRREDVAGAEVLDESAIPASMANQLRRSKPEYGAGSWDTSVVAANEVDGRNRALCRFYASAPKDLQRSMRAAVTKSVAADLLLFAIRASIFALRKDLTEAAHEEIKDGIFAIALANLANDDPRDDITVLQKVYEAGRRSGVDCVAAFKEAVPHYGPGVERIVDQYFLSRPEESVGKGFTFEEIDTPYGKSFELPVVARSEENSGKLPALTASTVMGLLCAPIGALSAFLVMGSATGSEYERLLLAAPVAAFVTGKFFWWLIVTRRNRTGILPGVLAGALAGAVAHYVGWYFALQVTREHLDVLVEAASYSASGFLSDGWITVPAGGILGGSFAVARRRVIGRSSSMPTK